MENESKIPSAIKSIRLHCLWCCKGSPYEVEKCPCSDCHLYPYRFGKNPNIRMTEEQMEKRREIGRRAQERLREKRAQNARSPVENTEEELD